MDKSANTSMDNRNQNDNPVTHFHMIISKSTDTQQYINKGTLIIREASLCIQQIQPI